MKASDFDLIFLGQPALSRVKLAELKQDVKNIVALGLDSLQVPLSFCVVVLENDR